MIGKLISTVTKIVTLPVDAANVTLDVLSGGDGTKKSRTQIPITGDAEVIRDRIAEAMESIDD